MYHPCYCEENVWHLARKRMQNANTQESSAANNYINRKKNIKIQASDGDYVVFISNENRTVALWSSSATEKDVILWDYHVILISVEGSGEASSFVGSDKKKSSPRVVVWDHDTRVCPRHVPYDNLENYLKMTFRVEDTRRKPYYGTTNRCKLDPGDESRKFEPLFRVIPANFFLEDFYSDRSHMLAKDSSSTKINGPKSQIWISPPPPWDCIMEGWDKRLKKYPDLVVSKVDCQKGDDIEGTMEIMDSSTSNRTNLLQYINMTTSCNSYYRMGSVFTLEDLRHYFYVNEPNASIHPEDKN